MLQSLLQSISPMDSLPHNQSNSNSLFLAPLYSGSQRRGSTSQMCLHKILSIITTVPPPLFEAILPFSVSETKESTAEDGSRSGFEFDLNVGFRVSPKTKECLDASMSSSSSTAVGDGGFFSVDEGNGSDRVENEEHVIGVSENSYVKIGEAERSLSLLIEAAKLIFGEFIDDDKSEPDVSRCSEPKRDEMAEDIDPIDAKLSPAAEMMEEFEEPPSPPVLRSKRGRMQVLPGKYRDSVLEPLTRFTRTRSSILPSKRRRR